MTFSIVTIRSPAARVMSLLIMTLLGGCTNSLVVVGNFPPPLSTPTDITMGVVYDKQVTGFVYKEESENRTRWLIDVGNIHKKFLTQVFEPLFASSIPLDSLDANQVQSADLILLPHINEFQYSSPKETRLNVYEVWIKYNMQVYNRDGELIADWIMSAYGKTPSAFLKSKEEAMNQAVIVALRDLGASLTSGFNKVPEIKAYLTENGVSS